MKSLIIVVFLTISVIGCAEEPYRVYPTPVGVKYVSPTYVRPGSGYDWRYHPNYGWGWYHPRYGWHYGWR